MNTMTKTICHRELTLVPGRRYYASRPIFDGTQKLFPIFIRDITDPTSEELVEVLEGLTYDEANTFLTRFNNEHLSFDGRIW